MATDLPHPLRDHWAAYQVAEARDTRGEKLAALDRFVQAVARADADDWHPWARRLAAQIVDDGAAVVVRRPLFERVLFPALADGLERGAAGCARWLAGMVDPLARCPACVERLGNLPANEADLLRLALRHDPADARARDRLIARNANFLDYTLHELPSGVLYGQDGASVAECDALLAELAEFRSLVRTAGRGAEFDDLIALCDFHYRAYRQYLQVPAAGDHYATFLARRQASRD